MTPTRLRFVAKRVSKLLSKAGRCTMNVRFPSIFRTEENSRCLTKIILLDSCIYIYTVVVCRTR